MEKDLISVIIPVYNVEDYIERCLKSVINQTYKHLEIIVVDDESPDNSLNIAKKIAENDKRIKFFHKKNGGLSDARNYGLARAKGKYICFVDSDDYIENEFVEKLYEAIRKNQCDISICNIKRVYDNHTSIDFIDDIKAKLCIRPAAWNKMYKKELFENNNITFPVGKWYEDLATTPKMTMEYKYALVDEALYNYVQRSNSITHTADNRIFDIYSVIENTENYMKEKKLYKRKYSVLEFMNIYHISIGTVYRAKSHKEFSPSMIRDIQMYVKEKYPEWYKNEYIKILPFYYKCYLIALRLKMYTLIYLCVKIFGNKVNL